MIGNVKKKLEKHQGKMSLKRKKEMLKGNAKRKHQHEVRKLSKSAMNNKTKHKKCTNIWRENKSFEIHQQPIKAKTTSEHHQHTTFATKQ